MNKRRERYNPVAMVKRDRALTAEMKVKDLRGEVHDLKKQLFRAQESARIANEEATARAMAQRQSGEALRAQLAVARDDAARWERTAEAAWAHNREFRDTSVWRIAAQRLVARLRRPA